MNDGNYKEVNFEKYCKTCEYAKLCAYADPCNECLESGMNEGTERPVLWEEKE